MKRNVIFTCGNESEDVLVYNIGALQFEVQAAVKAAAREINQKSKGKALLLKYLRKKLLGGGMPGDDVEYRCFISTDQKKELEIRVDTTTNDQTVVSLTSGMIKDEDLMSKWFQQTVTTFQRLQILNYGGCFI